MSWAAVAGAAVGVVGNQLGSKGGNTTSAQSNSPWGPVQQYWPGSYELANRAANQGYPASQQSQAMLRARGLAGTPGLQEANNLNTATLRGDYLNSNPFTQGAVQDAMGMAKSQINSQFSGNNFGSSAHQEWLGRGLMNASLPYLNQNYENERGRQYASMSQLPALQGLDYQNLQALQQADLMPFDFVNRYQSTLGSGGGGQSTTQTPYFTNPVNSAVGGALLGNQLYNSYTQNQQPNVTFGGSDPYAGGFGSGGYY